MGKQNEKQVPFTKGYFTLGAFKDYINDFESDRQENGVKKKYLFDLSSVVVWDTAALLWLVVSLLYYKESGCSIRLILPELNNQLSLNFNEKSRLSTSRQLKDATVVDFKFQKSGDFLRRWRFDNALRRLGPIKDTLVDEQEDYFNREKQFYKPKQVTDNFGKLEDIVSNKLFEFKNLAPWSYDGTYLIQEKLINDYTTGLKADDVLELIKSYGYSGDAGSKFATTLAQEALRNAFEHPNATFGMVVANKFASSNELVLSVADNGESICSTILDTLIRDTDYQKEHGIDVGKGFSLSSAGHQTVGEILQYATIEGVTCKEESDAGYGLDRIKLETLRRFKGTLMIVTSSVKAEYLSQDHYNNPNKKEWTHPWPGNLIRISIPIKSK